jgi:hypothetical protein
MNKIEARAAELSLPTQSLSEEQTISFYERCRSVICMPQHTTKGKRRRMGQLTWITAVDILRTESRNPGSSRSRRGKNV